MNASTSELASKYDSISSVYLQNKFPYEAFKLVDFEITDDVLDVGCGPGKHCQYLSPLVNSVIGFDISPGMIEFARRENSAPNIQYFEDDAQTFGDHHCDWSEKFNKIICFAVLHWCKNDERTLKNIYHCLKPGGTFILGFPFKFQLHGKTSCYGETGDMWIRSHPRWGSFLKDYDTHVFPREDSEMFLDCMRSVGFIIQKVEIYPGRWVQWNELWIKAQLRCLFDPVTQIPAQHRDEFIDDVYNWLYDVTPKRPNGVLQGELGRFEYIIILATKE